MKALLIMPYNCDLIHAVSLPLGILSIASYLRNHGHEAQIFDMSTSHKKLSAVIKEQKPDIIGISLNSCKHLSGAVHITKKLKGYGVPIVWGGPFCDVSDCNILLRDGGADYISLSEGEETWLAMMNALENGKAFDDLEGIAYLKDDKCIKTPERAFLDPLKLPELDFSLVDVKSYAQYLYGCHNLVYVYLSKGCPAHCTFCTNQLSHRCMYRRRSLDIFMHELEILVLQYGVDGIYFSDELCFFNKEQVYEVCNRFDESGLKFTWGFQTRVGILGEEELKRCYASGCRWIDFGIESGNKEQLKIMKKGIPYDKIEPTFLWCEKAGIISLANFIVGLPGETEEQLKDTVALASRIHATQCTFLKFCISPNTEMGKKAIQDGLMKHPITKISDYLKIDFFASKTDNFSKVKTKELDVIQSYYLWQAIFKKDYEEEKNDTKTFDLLIKHIQTLFRRLSFLHFTAAVGCLFELVLLFARFFFDTYFHPFIRKKYQLHKS